MKLDIKDLFTKIDSLKGETVILEGWVRNHRKQKTIGFIEFNDGTAQNSVQVVYDDNNSDFDNISKIKNGSALRVEGKVRESAGAGQDFEIELVNVEVLGDCPDEYPIQPKRHTREFLREQAYLRPRTNLFRAVFRVRSVAAHAIHSYFEENNYIYFNSPIITGDDCEGSGQMFKLTTLDMDNLPLTEDKKVDYSKDIFNELTYVTGTGQLHGEAFAMAFKKIYTFGPTFRTENSNTKTHANEFWMIEPEIAFCDLEGLMDIEESLLKYVVKYVMDRCPEEIKFFDKFVENGLIDKLNKVINSKFIRITHKEAIDLLKKSDV